MVDQFVFKKATKEGTFLRCAIFGPSGGGKTFTALRMATGMAQSSPGEIGVICTERGSARKYSHIFDFEVLDLEDKTIGGYIKAINAARAAGIKYIIIDSTTHAWDALLEQVDKLAKAKYRGNTWSAWSDGTPMQKAFIDAQLDYPGHLIATMRSKTEWTQEKNSQGKSTPVRVGLAPSQGKMIEYEYDFLLEMNTEHMATVIKDRTGGEWQDKIYDKPGEELGIELLEWLTKDGEPVVKERPEPAPEQDPAGYADDGFNYGPAVGKLEKLAEKTSEFINQSITPQDLKLFGTVHFTDDNGEGKMSRKQWSRVEFGICEEWLRECCRQMNVVDPTTYVVPEEG
jgi:hypothetical protein